MHTQVQTVAGHAFAELVERAAACDRIRGVLALLKRYENLFRLPTRIRQASDKGHYDQVRVLWRLPILTRCRPSLNMGVGRPLSVLGKPPSPVICSQEGQNMSTLVAGILSVLMRRQGVSGVARGRCEWDVSVIGTDGASWPVQVINEYKKARVLMSDAAATAKSGVWQSLFHEVEKVLTLHLVCCKQDPQGGTCCAIDGFTNRPSLRHTPYHLQAAILDGGLMWMFSWFSPVSPCFRVFDGVDVWAGRG